MKTCSKCHETKPIEEFPWKQKAKGIRHTYCNLCNKASSSEWYKNNKERHVKYVRARKGEVIQQLREYVSSLNLACSKCGFDHPAALDFHHVDPAEKEDSISNIINKGSSISLLKSEIEKCIVLCSNCHRIHHWQERQDSVS